MEKVESDDSKLRILAYVAVGEREAWMRMLQICLVNLREEKDGALVTPARLLFELHDARAELKKLCEKMGVTVDEQVSVNGHIDVQGMVKRITTALVADRDQNELRELEVLRRIRFKAWQMCCQHVALTKGEGVETSKLLWFALSSLLDEVMDVEAEPEDVVEAGQRLLEAAVGYRDATYPIGLEKAGVLSARAVLDCAMANWKRASSAPGTSTAQAGGEGRGAFVGVDAAQAAEPAAGRQGAEVAQQGTPGADEALEYQDQKRQEMRRLRLVAACKKVAEAAEDGVIDKRAVEVIRETLPPVPPEEPSEPALDQAKLIDLCRRLIGLVDNPEPGLSTYHMMCARAADEIRDVFPPKPVPRSM